MRGARPGAIFYCISLLPNSQIRRFASVKILRFLMTVTDGKGAKSFDSVRTICYINLSTACGRTFYTTLDMCAALILYKHRAVS